MPKIIVPEGTVQFPPDDYEGPFKGEMVVVKDPDGFYFVATGHAVGLRMGYHGPGGVVKPGWQEITI